MTLEARWRSKCRPGQFGCIEWTGAKDAKGYGILGRGGRDEGNVKAHVVAWELVHGPVPRGMVIDHTCRNTGCQNVEHLEPIESFENAQRGSKTKLTPEDVDRARARVAAGESRKTVAAELGVHSSHLSRVVSGQRWKKSRRRNDAPWRAAVIALRGEYCRHCGQTWGLECDHLKPRSQGGLSVVENGLMLCRSAHLRKTEYRLKIERSWLDEDQIAYLAEIGWVAWGDDGEPFGTGMRSFASLDERNR